MIGPALLVTAGCLAGGLAGGWAGAVSGLVAALAATFGVAAAAAWWAANIGRLLEPADAWQVAPRPVLFRPLCDAVYRRAFGWAPGSEAKGNP